MKDQYGDVSVTKLEGNVAQCEIKRPPNNFFDHQLIMDLADCFEDIDKENAIRSIVLCAEGKHFCAGANFSSSEKSAELETRTESDRNPLYDEAVRLFRCKKPVVAAIQGAAVGGGFGLALMADFRVICPATRMTANFVKLGFTPGFGLTHTLERIVGAQKANLLFMTGRRVNGETAYELGLGDVFTDNETVRSSAVELAAEIAENAPLALISMREQMRPNLAETVNDVTTIESREQKWLQGTNDHKEGVQAVSEKRPGRFTGS